MKNGWLKVDYSNPPKGDVLLLTASKVISKGDYWQNHCGEWGFRTEQSTWGLWGANEKECLSVLKSDDIIAYQPLPSTEFE